MGYPRLFGKSHKIFYIVAMKWVYAIKYKLQAAAVLTVIVFIVFAKSIIDKRNMTELGRDFISFYDDRLVVESYIFEITEQLFLMKLLVTNPILDEDQLRKDLGLYRLQILEILEIFEKTNLTQDEAVHLSQFKQNIENNFDFSGQEFSEQPYAEAHLDTFNQRFDEAFKDLRVLSEIQLYEGQKLTRESGQIINRSEVWTQLEMAVLVILLVIIYLLIFSSKSLRSKIRQNPSLN